MPHKHTRKPAEKGDYNIGPDKTAQPLPTRPAKTTDKNASRTGAKRNRRTMIEGYGQDDTPQAFARLMRRQTDKKPLNGLDNGESRRTKKAKTSSTAPAATTAPAAALKPLPGERMSDFNARVDQAMPVIGLARKGRQNIEGVKEGRTKTEKRMHKMYASWREEDARRKEAVDEARELAEEEEADQGDPSASFPLSRKKRREIGESAAKEEDIWAQLRDRREKPKGLHDVVLAPPELTVPKEKFKVRNGAKVDVANVPNKSGSLKKREELGDARREVIERYRAMMRGGKT